jgi:hypothetical protein
MLHGGKAQELQFLSTVHRKANNGHPIFPSRVCSCDIPSMRIVTVQCQNNEIFVWLHRRAKILENLHRTLFSGFIQPSSSLAFMLLLGNTRRARTHMSIAFMQVTTVVSECLSGKDNEQKCCLPCTPHDE